MRWTRYAVALLATPALAGVASAHDVPGGRFDAPLPLPLLFVGAGATVAVTAAWLARTNTPDSRERDDAKSRERDDAKSRERDESATETTTRERDDVLAYAVPAPAAGGAVLRAVGLAAFVGVLWFGLTGPQAAGDNPATLFVWAVALKGVGVVAVAAGSPWRALSPWRTVHEGFVALEGGEVALADYPDWLGVWPAVVGFVLLVGVTENLTGIPQSPRLTAGVLAAYAAAMVAGGLTFGRRFFERADALEVLYRLLGRVAVLEWRDGTVTVRAPWVGCTRRPTTPGVAAFVVAAVYTVSFDGFSNAPEYQTLYFAVFDVTGAYAHLVLYGVGLAGFLAAYSVVVAVADRLASTGGAAAADHLASTGADSAAERSAGTARNPETDRGAGRQSVRGAARAFAPTVVPIAAAYEVAHNYAFVARNLSQLVSLATGAGVDLLGWLPLEAFWWSQVVLVVAGHVLAVVAAHRVAVRRYGGDAGRGHLPLVALMVGYTVLSLWIVSRPVVS